MLVAIALIVVLLLFYIIGVYNRLQKLRTRIRAAIQEIGNQLKRQADLIPNLVEATKGYLQHEKSIFTQLAQARKEVAAAVASGDPAKMVAAQDTVKKTLGALQVIVESNPQIKGAAVVTQLMGELRDTADKVMYARRTLIDLAADYNQVLLVFPSNIVAKLFGFQPEKGLATPEEGKHLQVAAKDLKAPTVKLSK